MVHPGDEDDDEAQREGEDGGENSIHGIPHIAVAVEGDAGGNFNIDDEQRHGDGKYAVAKSLQPCIGFFHGIKGRGF